MGKIIGFFGGSASGGVLGGGLFMITGKIGLVIAGTGVSLGLGAFLVVGAVTGGFIAGLVVALKD